MMLSISLMAQSNSNTIWVEFITFDDPWDTFTLKLDIDTTDTDNIWQVGYPQKTEFNPTLAPTKTIVTDTVNTYGSNDTSFFIIQYLSYNCPSMGGYYAVDSDSLKDYGLIEISTDFGQTWINALDDSTVFQPEKPILTGNSNGWQYFELNFAYTMPSGFGDTLLVKFTFISDSIDTGRDGLMFDNLGFCILVNTENLKRLNTLKVFPNPTQYILNFELEEPIENGEIRIFNTIGQLQEQQNFSNKTLTQFKVSTWNSGTYYYGIFVEGNLVKQGQVLIGF